ncbi:hypothetical protein RMS29_027620 (plasmid) [Agrobacterium rosae]|uniref:Uncharacterized protein n=1 Tax=Agrobacterium rosae TaxID=1972867 RepID=A0AAW9FPV6_9HYPH|nr:MULTISPECIES: hypothetical protein [Agrobacterium]MDX8321723.1 hypothetical protein [Agrobacterium sp. rho-8.1]MDX8305186.1 hypothetical protein [Agrobacterium rosae]MDX8311469.1 hypothetical protein [Agrobacterium sp. rho-13.3]MDX8316298.1 hypothetical protein [Agrobacterium rosae]MDX8332395.1 hypothetical protein [Agrobacterium rosae]
MSRQMMIGAMLAMAALTGCTTTEGQQSTDAFVAREMSKHGVQGSTAKTTSAPDRVLVAPSS